MKLNVKTSAEKERMGLCPECKEWTTAGDSCCGNGALVEGGHISDEQAQEEIENPTVGITIIRDADEEKARAVHRALFNAGVISNMWGVGGHTNKWNVSIVIPVESVGEAV